jgi:serine-type D-Ala-D-Ala endopeptidase (penicillin-binding protein 7)
MKKFITFIAMLMAMSCHAEITAKSWIVSSRGQIVEGKNAAQVRPIGSITKLMTVMVYLDASKTNQKLVQSALVSSNNRAAKQLCDDYPGGRNDCIFMMNLKAKELGLTNTKFVEPTGLSVFNTSTAEELIKIVEAASAYPEIVNASRTVKGNTNPTIGKYDYSVSKTGYIHLAGGCVVAKVKDKVVVILGSKNTHTRIPELEKLLRL